MTEIPALLRLLQEGDSFFPSGATSFSWGVETLCAEGAIRSEKDVATFVIAQLKNRWAPFDRAIITAAAHGAATVDRIADIDRRVEAQTLAAELRSGSRRHGNGLLAVHVQLGTNGASEYSALVREGKAFGHLVPMQGYLWSRRGIAANEAATLSAHLMLIGFLGATVRIGVIGNAGAQRILTAAHGHIAALLDEPPPSLDEINAFMPQTEIASMRHEVAQTRIFAN
jgi:urease accessory protein